MTAAKKKTKKETPKKTVATKAKAKKEKDEEVTPPAVEKKSNAKLDAAMSDIRSKFGDDSIMMLGEQAKVDVDTISTGSIGIDWALGIGGLPRGRIVEVYGPESSGKTTLSLHVIAEAQKKGGVCAFIDAEHAMDPIYAKKLGVKTQDLLISQPNTGEQALEIVESLVRSGNLDVIVIDSVAALTPKDEIEGDMGAHQMGKQARLMSQAMRKLTSIVSKSGTIIIFINQVRMKIGMVFGNPETTTGGKALKFYSSVRIDIRRIAQIKKGTEVMGGRHRAKIVKNKVAAPFRMAEFDLIFNEGISREGELLALGEKMGVVEKNGASYKFDDISLGRGYDAARTFLRENKKVASAVLKEIKTALKDTV